MNTPKLTNPRRKATIKDWPGGPAHFLVEHNSKRDPQNAERIMRTTTGKPKFTTYHRRMAIVDGDDGKTYLLGFTDYGFISVLQGNMKSCAPWPLRSPGAIHKESPSYEEVSNLIEAAYEVEQVSVDDLEATSDFHDNLT